MNAPDATRSPSWKWWVCGLLLLASSINYMDRQTLANAAVRIGEHFHLNDEQYGKLEFVFGWAFAAGSLLFGFVVDRFSVHWLYPVVLALWSAVGFSTGHVDSYGGLLTCRTLLGLFEGGHWPCAVKATQRLLEPRERAMGNSVLQSGTSIGAMLTPVAMRFLLTSEQESWRVPFQVVGALGAVWVVAWFLLLRGSGVFRAEPSSTASRVAGRSPFADLLTLFRDRRMWILFVVVACINTGWQTLRAWLPKFLQQGRHYSETQTLDFTAVFYLATDVGCLGAGAFTFWLVRRGLSVEDSRMGVFLGCALVAALAVVAALSPPGWVLLAALLAAGAGALGVFPIYHAFTQDVSAQHQGKVTGITGVAAWVFSSPAQILFGRMVDRTGSFDLGLAVAGLLPLTAFLVLWLFWPGTRAKDSPR